MTGWVEADQGTLRLPSGELVRARSLRRASPSGPDPEFGLYLLGRAPRPVSWPTRWVRWPDFGLPRDRDDAIDALREAGDRLNHERIEIACGGGRGRTGTALACIAVLQGIPASEAVTWVRRHYDRRAVETPWQRRFVLDFPPH